MKLRGRFALVPFPNTTGTTSWRVTGTKLSGERVRENFHEHDRAMARKQELEMEVANVSTTAKLKTTRLSDDQVAEAERAFAELDGKPMMHAVRFYLANYREPKQAITVAEAFQLFIAAKEKDKCRPDTIRNLRQRVGTLARQFPEAMVSEITQVQIGELIARPEVDSVTKDNDRRALSSFFSWCMEPEQGFCASNPAKLETRKRQNGDDHEPDVLSLASVRKLLDAARRFKEGKLVPYVALGLFCAIRPTELARLSWREIDLDAKTVTIGAKLAKMRSRRIVDISDNAIAWLAPCAGQPAAIKGPNWRKEFNQVRKLASIRHWTQDVLRHTGVSHHLAFHQHEGKTAAWAGNSPDVVQKHYRGLVKRSESAEFWALRPTMA